MVNICVCTLIFAFLYFQDKAIISFLVRKYYNKYLKPNLYGIEEEFNISSEKVIKVWMLGNGEYTVIAQRNGLMVAFYKCTLQL